MEEKREEEKGEGEENTALPVFTNPFRVGQHRVLGWRQLYPSTAHGAGTTGWARIVVQNAQVLVLDDGEGGWSANISFQVLRRRCIL